MNITFGIITNGNNDIYLEQIIKSIKNQNIPKYEIIVVGKTSIKNNIINIPFNEDIKKDWISRKKNIIAQTAKYDILVIMHDYYQLLPNWYKGFMEFGEDWDICMTIIENTDSTRYRDWVSWNDPEIGKLSGFIWHENGVPWASGTHHSPIAIVPYTYDKTENLYIDGGYWVCKKHVMIEQPIDETRLRGQGEDVEWSKRVRGLYKYVINTHSKVKLLKYKLTQAKTIEYV